MRAADLLLCVFDASAALSDADRSFINEALACSGRKIAVLNKLDLGQAEYDMPGFDSYVRVSAARGDGAESSGGPCPSWRAAVICRPTAR